MKRALLTSLGIAVMAVAAVYLAKGFLRPAQEKVERGQAVLTGAYRPSLVECTVVADAELPRSLPPPKVDEDLLYIEVTVLYPGVERVPSPRDHRLVNVNGRRGAVLEPVHIGYEVDDEGTYLSLIYRTDNGFEGASLAHAKRVLFENVVLE